VPVRPATKQAASGVPCRSLTGTASPKHVVVPLMVAQLSSVRNDGTHTMLLREHDARREPLLARATPRPHPPQVSTTVTTHEPPFRTSLFSDH
jgi:hypothetical protein